MAPRLHHPPSYLSTPQIKPTYTTTSLRYTPQPLLLTATSNRHKNTPHTQAQDITSPSSPWSIPTPFFIPAIESNLHIQVRKYKDYAQAFTAAIHTLHRQNEDNAHHTNVKKTSENH